MDKKNRKHLIAWGVTTGVVTALMITVGVLATSTFAPLLNTVFGGDVAIVDPDSGEAKYPKESANKDEARKKGEDVTEKINEEGIIMLKNQNNALPLTGAKKISVFGKNSVNPVYGGSGSAAGNADKSQFANFYSSLEAAGFETNQTLKDFYLNNSKSGNGRSENLGMDGNTGMETLDTGETPQSSYSADIKASYDQYKDAAIIVLARIGGEGWDLPRTTKEDSSKHYLELDSNEADLIRSVCAAGFGKVVLVINSNNPMELGFLNDSSDPNYNGNLDAALWCGGFGSTGVKALGKILNGTVNPSGHTVDTFAKDFTQDPTWKNFGTNLVENGDRYTVGGKNKQYYFVDYEEGIYVGYRYYETRGFTDGEDWYKNAVAFPFGYGLSYTTFDWSLENKSTLENSEISKDGAFKLQVKVTNTGSVAGKDVVQIYATAPYTSGQIEKAHKVLVGYEKTPLIEPGKDATVEIEINPYYLASYDYADKNSNGFKGYELEKGDYTFYVSSDAHTSRDDFNMKISNDIRYENDPVTGKEVKNLYDDADDELSTVLSRSDWNGTFPTTRSADERATTDDFIKKVADTSVTVAPDVKEMPKTGQATSLKLADMVEVPYDDPRWDELVSSLTVDEMFNMYYYAAFNTAAISSIEKPRTTNADGPQGFVVFMGDPTVYGTNLYPNEPVVGATWNKELVKEQGKAFGEEGLIGNEKGDKIPYSGIYAPGVNIHRSPFGGRLGEYYSEDGYFNGVMAANFAQRANEKGLITYTKHFALNEQETHRSSNGLITWANEQSIREIYLRPFEINVKEGKTLGMMSSFNRIGTVWAGGDYRLLTTILREEWGFKGVVITDFNTNRWMNTRQALYAGNDLNLATVPAEQSIDTKNKDDVYLLQQTAKRICYSVVNSNAMNVKVSGYRPSNWKIIVYVILSIISLALVVWGGLAFFFAFKKKKEK